MTKTSVQTIQDISKLCQKCTLCVDDSDRRCDADVDGGDDVPESLPV